MQKPTKQNAMPVSDDPEVAMALSLLADKLRERGKESLAFKIENLIELVTEELEAQQNKKPQYLFMSIAITEDVTVEDIDEAIKHIFGMLKTDEYGNRMDWRKKELLQNSIDDLLDARLKLTQEGTVE